MNADGTSKQGVFGALSLFWGTFYISLIAMLTALPLGVMCAIYLGVFAGKKSKNYLKPILEIIAGIPTVVFGFFAAIVVAPFIVWFFLYLAYKQAFKVL